MPRSSQRHNREIFGLDSAGETPGDHGEIGNDPSAPSLPFLPWEEDWSQHVAGTVIAGQPTPIGGTWEVSPGSVAENGTEIKKGTFAKYLDANPQPVEGVWSYWRMFMKNTDSAHLPEFVHATAPTYLQVRTNWGFYLFDDEGAYNNANTGDLYSDIAVGHRANVSFIYFDYTGSLDSQVHFRLLTSEEGTLDTVTHIDHSEPEAAYDEVWNLQFFCRNNAGAREIRYMVEGQFDSGWVDITALNISPLNVCKLFPHMGQRYRQGEANRGGGILVEEYS